MECAGPAWLQQSPGVCCVLSLTLNSVDSWGSGVTDTALTRAFTEEQHTHKSRSRGYLVLLGRRRRPLWDLLCKLPQNAAKKKMTPVCGPESAGCYSPDPWWQLYAQAV